MSLHSQLQHLADDGFSGLPVDEFRATSESCWALAQSTGDARWALIARSLELMLDCWREDGVDTTFADRAARSFRQWLPEIIDDAAPAERASSLAGGMLDELHQLCIEA